MFGSPFHNFERHSHPFDRFSHSFEKRSRMFKRGDMKFVILDLLKDKPAHGYEVTQSLEERFHGLYSPSTGSVYPVLQLLEDMEYVTSSEVEGKKIYTITDGGKKFLHEQEETTQKIKERLWGWGNAKNQEYLQNIRTTMNYLDEIRELMGHIAVHNDPAKIIRVNNILDKTLEEMEIVYREK
ncbi:PadR family transcriptional regulator [Dehalococcoides mccartyi]|jgi:DNA-binding PadR family transcriptional regulator|uniref:PadR family transcripitonal regulator n=2 Tax=Dehalococcoidaceae TaxID=1202464 RepID=A0A142VAG2_9CHLR|nr:transcriptional regulator, PadR family [Dehalococcoides mccartyi DCMB5]AII61139.1 PadR family transcriptional regulator [Dehalococcoides mccartyi CG5]AMU86826.1 PadR family transcripitonal regulator [Dehalococcoides mccartyi]AOV99615.1 transcriptional regulator [Dehalococcoides mccartyi]MBA2085394.1 Transcriptional regulator, PadR family [Dehalococcoides mccartyi]